MQIRSKEDLAKAAALLTTWQAQETVLKDRITGLKRDIVAFLERKNLKVAVDPITGTEYRKQQNASSSYKVEELKELCRQHGVYEEVFHEVTVVELDEEGLKKVLLNGEIDPDELIPLTIISTTDPFIKGFKKKAKKNAETDA